MLMQSHSQLKCDDATLFPYTNVFTPEKGKHFFPDCLEMRICVGKVLDKKPQVKMESGEPSEVLSEDDLSLLECLRAILSEV